MPGFSRLEKQIFYNLMTASRDPNDHNVRVTSDLYRDASAPAFPTGSPNGKLRQLKIESPEKPDGSGDGSEGNMKLCELKSFALVTVVPNPISFHIQRQIRKMQFMKLFMLLQAKSTVPSISTEAR